MDTTSGLTRSETFVNALCTKTFLSLWCHQNPRGKPGKEICDLLIVCDPDVVIVSVKEIGVKKDEHGELIEASAERWKRKAIDESIKQLRGAERFLETATRVVRSDGSLGLPLPAKAARRIHRIAVACGSEREVPYTCGEEDGVGFVHVFDEVTFETLIQELDTITDFLDYLTGKEAHLTKAPLVCFGEENLLACYLLANRTFPKDDGVYIIKDGWWEKLKADPGYLARIEADKKSYYWDDVIEHLVHATEHGDLVVNVHLDQVELAYRTLARETRFGRRTLSSKMLEFIRDAEARKTRARMMRADSGVGYVFMAPRPEEHHEDRIAELAMHTFIARGRLPDCTTVVGLSALREGPGLVFESAFIQKAEWTKEDQAEMDDLQRETGFFVDALAPLRHREHEYPLGLPARSSKMKQ